ncbi:hypothetical protein P175DRAFT_0439589 [Aspergillus ochraceoroseus IBT 24754]|uniref:Uncharacterized protein n=3 Tax=Aspergillus subgen. Nidulantes TaxID=2720870 RepID=A0A0F8V9N5_9EURO|nr:uncharacterized protein P175DRAFT_0439589 [Aspergillus ochraceoroseus IBT 24754]KKK14590.1 hypothetical protein AOCH_007119 [Aspergillus ochraceoroseus]KKK19716.1 hypothetical protein ARAM_005416 [Aspergillus rambellii]PTU20236.1 hypothetical protein P175DRAFT_0439589 [Aspergillus ochraceoroseus IBT 24754]
MCRQYLTLYSWCHCEEDAGYQACSARKENGCPGTAVETVHMQCFCNVHATKKFQTEKQALKKKSRSSLSSRSSRNSRYSNSSLESQASQISRASSFRRRWFRLWSRSE